MKIRKPHRLDQEKKTKKDISISRQSSGVLMLILGIKCIGRIEL